MIRLGMSMRDWKWLFFVLYITYNGVKTNMCCCISVASACRKSSVFPYIFDHLPYISPIFHSKFPFICPYIFKGGHLKP